MRLLYGHRALPAVMPEGRPASSGAISVAPAAGLSMDDHGVGSLRGVPVIDENSRPVEKARLEVLQRLLCS
jgi:hypothetical protein